MKHISACAQDILDIIPCRLHIHWVLTIYIFCFEKREKKFFLMHVPLLMHQFSEKKWNTIFLYLITREVILRNKHITDVLDVYTY